MSEFKQEMLLEIEAGNGGGDVAEKAGRSDGVEEVLAATQAGKTEPAE